jgi:crotonobetainyl-CoA:carnitine CoA-transferase CaiB-like acyl-CoA transferase
MVSALKGLKVLDLTRQLPGPYCTLVLADHGAEVIKLEAPPEGDILRTMGTMLDEDSVFFWQLNRNKKSITLNLKEPGGLEIFKKMILDVDVLVEGFRPGVMKRLGLGYQQLQEINPRLIYCAITGYGQNGPYSLRPGHNLNYMSFTGLLRFSSNGEAPIMPDVPLADVGGGTLWALISILLALQARERTGRGQFLDISMAAGVLACLPMQLAEFFFTKESPKRDKAILLGYYACYNIFETKDGKYMSVGALETKFWENFCTAMGRPDWIELHYAGSPAQEKLKEEVAALFKERSQKEWVELFSSVDTPVEALRELEETIKHPQFQGKDLFLEIPHEEKGTIKQLGFPCRLPETPARYYKAPPRLGEDTEPLLKKLGYTLSEINILREKGIV